MLEEFRAIEEERIGALTAERLLEVFAEHDGDLDKAVKDLLYEDPVWQDTLHWIALDMERLEKRIRGRLRERLVALTVED